MSQLAKVLAAHETEMLLHGFQPRRGPKITFGPGLSDAQRASVAAIVLERMRQAIFNNEPSRPPQCGRPPMTLKEYFRSDRS